MFKRFLAILLLLSVTISCGCQTTLDGSETGNGSTPNNTANTPESSEEFTQPVVPISVAIDTALFKYPAQNESFYYEVYDTYISITKYVGQNSEHVVIPDVIEGKPVYKIANYAFEGSAIGSLDISKNVYIIGEGAFSGCKYLRTVNFVDVTETVDGFEMGTGAVTVGAYAFSGCSALLAMRLPYGVTSIGKEAFSGCVALLDIVLPDTIADIGSSAFYACQSLEQLTIPPLVTFVSYSLCSGCTSLADVYIGAAVTEIAFSAFTDVPSTVVFHGVPESAAAEYAASHFFGFEIIQASDLTDVAPETTAKQ